MRDGDPQENYLFYTFFSFQKCFTMSKETLKLIMKFKKVIKGQF